VIAAEELSGAVGFALSDRLTGRDRSTVACLSDGELEEGQVWEAAMFAAHAGLERLTVVLDANGSQVDGTIASVTTIEPVVPKWEAFGWSAIEVDGHDVSALNDAFRAADAAPNPEVVVARTDIFGGHGSAVAEALAEAGVGRPLRRVGIGDVFAESGSRPYLFAKYGWSVQRSSIRPGTQPGSPARLRRSRRSRRRPEATRPSEPKTRHRTELCRRKARPLGLLVSDTFRGA
jgi:transketolase